MAAFKHGVVVNSHPCGEGEYRRLRISAGPLRGVYVDVLVLEAKIGRKLHPGMTVEHIDGDSLNCDPSNLIEVTQSENTIRMWKRISKNGGKRNHGTRTRL